MIIINLSQDNLCFATLKDKIGDPDTTLGPGGWLDTDALGISEEKARKSSEVKMYEAMKKIKLASTIPGLDGPPEEAQKTSHEKDVQNQLLNIGNSCALSELEDIIKDEKMDIAIRKAAYTRYQELTGDQEFENPELEQGVKNPIVG